MHVIRVPYHLDEYLPDLDLPWPSGLEVTVALPTADVWARLAALHSEVGRAVTETVRGGAMPVVVSGDCTTALGTVAGLQQADVDAAIIWLDAHGDVQTLETTTSGYLGGLPLRLLVGYRPELIATRLALRPVPEQRVVLAGARDLDPPEASYLASSRVRRRGLSDLSAADLPDGPLYVHLDVDVIDPAEIPALRYPVPAGPSTGQVSAALQLLLGTGRVAAVGIACSWHPGTAVPASLSEQLEEALASAAN